MDQAISALSYIIPKVLRAGVSNSGLERPAESDIEGCGHPLVSMAPWRVDEGCEPVEKLTHTEFDAVL